MTTSNNGVCDKESGRLFDKNNKQCKSCLFLRKTLDCAGEMFYYCYHDEDCLELLTICSLRCVSGGSNNGRTFIGGI